MRLRARSGSGTRWRRAIARGMVAAGAFTACALHAQAQALYDVPVQSTTAVLADWQPLRVVLHAREPRRLAAVLGMDPPAGESDALAGVLGEYATPRADPAGTGAQRTWLEATFALDHDDAGVAALAREFVARLGHAPADDDATRKALVEFVAGTMHPSFGHGFDIASQVARGHAGDCTEYAVLVAALARSVGIPARVVVGMALVALPDKYEAAGHAWAELRVQGTWQVGDAALQGLHRPVWYMPFGVLQEEGMGFAGAFLRLTPMWVQRVEVLGVAAPSPGTKR